MSIVIIFGPPGDSLKSRFFNETVVAAPFNRRAGMLYIVPSVQKRKQLILSSPLSKGGVLPNIVRFSEIFLRLYQRLGGSKGPVSETAATYLVFNILRTISTGSVSMDIPPATGGLAQELVQHIKKIETAGMSSADVAAMPDAMDGYGSFFLTVFERYEKTLAEGDRIDPWQLAAATNDLARRFEKKDLFENFLPWKEVVVDGFIDFTPPQLDLLRKLSEEMSVAILWPGRFDDFFQPAATALKAAFPEAEWQENEYDTSTQPSKYVIVANRFSRYLDEPSIPEFTDTENKAPRLKIIEADSARDEIKAIARYIKSNWIQSNDDLSWKDFCVAFPDLETYAPLIRRIFRRYGLPADIVKPLPFSSSPAFRMLSVILSVPPLYHRKTLLALLKEPLLDVLPGRPRKVAIAILDNISRQLKIIQGKSNWLRKLTDRAQETLHGVSSDDLTWFRETLENMFDILAPLEQPATFSEYVHHLRHILDAFHVTRCLTRLTRPERRSAEAEDTVDYLIRSYGALIQYFDEMESLPPHIRNEQIIDLDIFRQMFSRLVSGVTYQLTHADQNRIRVLGLREIRGLSFKYVFLGGLNEISFPGSEAPSPFWKSQVRDELLGVPPRHDRYLAASDLYRALLVPENELVLARPVKEGETDLLPSPLWHRLLACYPKIETILPVTETPLSVMEFLMSVGNDISEQGRAEIHSSSEFRNMMNGIRFSCLNRTDLNQLKPLISNKKLLAYLGEMVSPERALSVSAIQQYVDCPRRFFYSVVLRLAPPEEPASEPGPLDTGIWIHEVFNRFYRERIRSQKGRIKISEKRQARKRLLEIARETAREFALDNLYMDVLLDVFTGTPDLPGSGIADQFIDQETDIDDPLDPVRVEFSFGRAGAPDVIISHPEDTDEISVRLSGRIDRIDSWQGEYVIYDYKSGGIPSGTEIKNMAVVQMWLYALAVEQILGHLPRAAMYYQVSFKKGCKIVKGIGLENTPPGNLMKEICGRGTLLYQEGVFRDQLRLIRKQVIQIAEGIRNGHFPVVEEESTCRNCLYTDVCRRVIGEEHEN